MVIIATLFAAFHVFTNQSQNMLICKKVEQISRVIAKIMLIFVKKAAELFTVENIMRGPSSESGLKSDFFCSEVSRYLIQPTIDDNVLNTHQPITVYDVYALTNNSILTSTHINQSQHTTSTHISQSHRTTSKYTN